MQDKQQHPYKLLVVDDEPANIFMLEGVLDAEGFAVATATDGENALLLLEAESFDAVLMDIMMPKMTGLDVLKIAKDRGITSTTPFIMVSAKVQSTDVEAALQLGAIEYIRKPVDEIELLARLNSVLKIREQDLKLKQLNEQLKKKNEIILSSIESAKKIQNAIFPTEEDLNKYLPGSFIYFQPKDVVSGDFYWFTNHKSKTIVVEGDCTGHGVPGAFLSLIGSSLLDKIVLQNREFSPKKILEELSTDFIQSLNRNINFEENFIFDGMDISVACIDREDDTIHLSSAGQDMLYITRDSQVHRIQGGLFSIGYEMEAMNGGRLTFEEHAIPLQELHSVILFSDGFIDQFGGEKNEKFMLKRFTQIFKEHKKTFFEHPQEILHSTFSDWSKGDLQTDDILVVGLFLEN